MSILNHFPGTPRQAQTDALLKLEQEWQNADVFIVSAPTGAGKSLIALTIARWAHKKHKQKTSVTTPTKLLVDQYVSLMPKLHTIRNMKDYECETYRDQEQTVSCKRARELCEEKRFCAGCPYMKDVKKAHVMPYGVYNSWTYMAHRLFRDVVIFDEGHLAIGMVQSLAAKKLWKWEYNYPTSVRNYQQLLTWVSGHKKRDTDAKLKKLYEELTSGKAHYLVERTTDLFRGEEEELLKLLPIDVRDAPPNLWPHKKVKKLVFLSATMGIKDVEALGLDRKRVCYIEVNSPIPKDRRPVFFTPIGNMSVAFQDQNMDALIYYIESVLNSRKEAGMIHAPYSLAAKIAKRLEGNPRILFHTQQNKKEVYDRFRENGPAEGLVLIGSGLYEGISLDDDAGRWQLITKIPFPNLGEPGYRWIADKDPEAYAWQAIRLVVQATGRICRGPEDYGETFIVDESFRRLITNYRHLFPNYFKEAMVST
jgi:Rad3-related DNA helicase